MPAQSLPSKELKKLLSELLPADQPYQPVIKTEIQAKQFALLEENIPNESFYFVFNLVTGEFDRVGGVEKWLGYSSKEFTMDHYMNCIHPGQSVLLNMIARSMYKVLCKGTFKLQFGKQKYLSLIGLRHYDGGYVMFKKTTSIFQYDNENRMLSQLNEFTKIDSYQGEALKPRIAELEGFQKGDFERMIFEMTLKAFMEKKFFSAKELEILRYYATDHSLSRNQLSTLLNVATTTIDTYNKRILAKARETFTHPFFSSKDVALYLKKERIL